MALNGYLAQVQNLLGTSASQNLYSNSQLTTFINEARRQTALHGQCVRALSPISGSISALTLTSGGSGYQAVPTVVINPPDFPNGFLPNPNGVQASAVCTISGGAVNTLTLLSGGTGYFSPGIVFTGGSPVNEATATVTVNNITATNAGQEQYPFSGILSAIQSAYSGIESVVAVRSVSFIWGTYRYTTQACSFSRYQALVRTYSQAYQYIPSVVSQYAQGIMGTLFMYPVANSQYQFEADTQCVPIDLVDDNTFEAIPHPWRNCVQYYAAYKALLGVGRYADAQKLYEIFTRQLVVARQASQPSQINNWYGRAT